MKVFSFLYILLFAYACDSLQPEFNVSIDLHEKISELSHFWESTGLCPPLPHSNASAFLLSTDMKQNLLLASSVPHNGIKQVRVHWLLELITKNDSSYDFFYLDQFMSFLHSLQLKPGFEIMGNPSNYFSNFDDLFQVRQFKELVTILAKRYISMFGLEYVKSWNFETWNEPDHEDFDNITMTVEGFLKYFDACSDGLGEASLLLKFGGPGGSCRQKSFSKRCWALFDHITKGISSITGKALKLDYISFHKKGNGTARKIIVDELSTISEIHDQYPSLSATPIFNDEADPLVGWSAPHTWRADVTYAALIAKVICLHQNEIISYGSKSNIDYALLSNDDGFLSFSPHYFTQRTLNARFQMNNTEPKHVHFVKKPALAVMGLLSKLGDQQIARINVDEYIGGISSTRVSKTFYEVSTLLYNSADSTTNSGKDFIRLHFDHFLNLIISTDQVRAITCSLNNQDTNPYLVWQKLGSPNFPSPADFELMHRSEGPACSDPKPVFINSNGSWTDVLQLDLPGVALHLVCLKPLDGPGSPENLQAMHITVGQILLTWSDMKLATKCIQTYVIEFSTDQHSGFRPINDYKVVFNSFTYITDHPVTGFFRVYAIDFWNRKSISSNIVSVSD